MVIDFVAARYHEKLQAILLAYRLQLTSTQKILVQPHTK